MVLYCSAHETTVLRMLVHKMKNHPNEEMVYFTTVGTYPFHKSNRDFSALYKKVIEFNTALGKNISNKDEIKKLIINEMNRLLEINEIDLNECNEIYVVEDIYHPYTIYFESLGIPYTAIEISPNAFDNKSKFTLEKNLYKRTAEYFELAQELGAFAATGKNCKNRFFNIESITDFNQYSSELTYDYVEAISTLSQSELDKCIELYGIPNNIEKNNEFAMVLTNSRGFIEGRHNEITYKEIPRIYQKFIDYYLAKEKSVYIKPHPNSQGVKYRDYFDENKIIEEKFLVDLIPFIENVKMGGVINIASSASMLLEKYCTYSSNLGENFFVFSLNIQKIFAILQFVKENNLHINKIYTTGIDAKQIENYLSFNNIENIEVDIFMPESVLDENTLVLISDLKILDEMLSDKLFDVKNHHALIGVLSENTAFVHLRNNKVDISAYTIETTEFIKKTGDIETHSCLIMSDNSRLKDLTFIKELPHSKNVVEIRSTLVLYNKKVCVFGGNVVRWIVGPLKQKFDVTYLPWISPLSISSQRISNADNFMPSNEIGNDIELNKNIIKWISDTDYFLFDLETLRYDLLELEDSYFTDTRAFRNLELYKSNENRVKVCNVFECDNGFIEQKLNKFIDLLLSVYKPENIILVRHGQAINSYISNHIIKNWKTEKYNQFISNWENYIINKVNCRYIDIWKYYMSKYGENTAFFEKSYYNEVNWDTISMITNSKLSCVNDVKFSHRLNGYLTFYEFATYRKFASFFMLNENPYEKFLLKTSKSFIEHNYVSLIHNKGNNLEFLNESSENSSCHEIKQAYDEIVAIENDIFLKENISLDLVFKYKFEILKSLEIKLKNQIENTFGISIDVNANNIFEVYLIVKQLYNHMISEAHGIALLKSINSLTQRTYIDVWGSCVSREIFNMDFNHFKVNTYLMRNSIIHTGFPPVDIPIEILSPDKFTNEWVYRNCNSEWNRTCEDRLNASEAKWIVIDLHDVFFPNYYYKNDNNIFCKTFNLDFMPFYKIIEKDIYPFDYSDDKYDDEFFIAAIQRSIEILKQKYGNNVIVIDTSWKKQYVDEHRIVKNFSLSEKENKAVDRKNHIAKLLSNYLVDKLNCYHISFLNEYLADELWHGGEISQSHYEKYFYEEAYAVIEKIVRTKPEQREYSHSRISTRIERIIELSSQKSNYEYLHSIYDTYLDTLLIQIDNYIIDKYKNVIECIYLKNFQSAQQMFEHFDFESNNAIDLKLALYNAYRYI